MAGPFTPAWLGYDPSVKPFAYDPAKAKALLAEAGFPQGLDTTWSISSGVFLKDTEIAEADSTAMNAARTVVAVASRPNRRSRRALGIFTFGNRSASAGRARAGMVLSQLEIGCH